MYDELVKRLRNEAESPDNYPEDSILMQEAADAIEKLQKRVPKRPHGRLVDADKLTEEMRLYIKENMLSRDDARELLETIEDAPAVIETEGEERWAILL